MSRRRPRWLDVVIFAYGLFSQSPPVRGRSSCLPFLEFATPNDLLSLFVLMAVVGTLYVSSDLIYINPMLAIAGYQVYEVALKEQAELLILVTRAARPAKREMASGARTEPSPEEAVQRV